MTLPKYAQVAASIRAQIVDGALSPGQPAPSGAALARATGFSTLTCRKALRTLIKDRVLVPGTSPNARPRVPGPATRHEQTLASAARALSASLARHRRAAGLTQPQLAELADVSVTTIGHAETGRLWQSRDFWERADEAVSAHGELLALHDAYRAAAVPADPATVAEVTETATSETGISADVPSAVAASGPVTCVTITWADGSVTTVYPPETMDEVDDETRAVLESIQRERGPDTTLADVVRDALRKYAAEWHPGWLPAEAVELAVHDAAEERAPLLGCEHQDRPLAIPAIADADHAARQARDLGAVAVREAQRAFDPFHGISLRLSGDALSTAASGESAPLRCRVCLTGRTPRVSQRNTAEHIGETLSSPPCRRATCPCG
jgi:hypothetical protein